jgi:hypothetical protein
MSKTIATAKTMTRTMGISIALKRSLTRPILIVSLVFDRDSFWKYLEVESLGFLEDSEGYESREERTPKENRGQPALYTP